MILASPEILLNNAYVFWLRTVRHRKSPFCRHLACIAVDKAHLLWGWRVFRKKYGNVGVLRVVFPDIIALSATITRNVLGYIHDTLHLHDPVRLYKSTLDRPNITYMVNEIVKRAFGELAMLLPHDGRKADIPKTMVFVDKIDESIQIVDFLEFLLRQILTSSFHKATTIILLHFSCVLYLINFHYGGMDRSHLPEASRTTMCKHFLFRKSGQKAAERSYFGFGVPGCIL